MKEHAIARGIRGFTFVILNSNVKMIALARKTSKDLKSTKNSEVIEITAYFD